MPWVTHWSRFSICSSSRSVWLLLGSKRAWNTLLDKQNWLQYTVLTQCQNNDKIATLLSIDMADAFDIVSYQRLTHNLWKRNRTTTLIIYQNVTKQFIVKTKTLQESFLSLNFYLFYNADLFDICNQPGTNTNALRFIDNINVLAYKSLEKNCRTLETVHTKCKKCASQHGAVLPHTDTNLFTCLAVLKSLTYQPSSL